MRSLNVAFSGEVRKDAEFENPPGAHLARAIEKGLKDAGYTAEPFDNWRDVGWKVDGGKGGEKVSVAFAKFGQDWMLQVYPTHQPGLIGTLMKKRPSASPQVCLDVGAIISEILTREGLSNFKWRQDGNPQENFVTTLSKLNN